MNLQNNYKVLYAEAIEGNRVFKASETGFYADAKEIASIEMNKYKLVYEKDGKFYGSEENVPTDNDTCFDAFDQLFVEKEDSDTENEPEVTEPSDEPRDEEPKVEEDESVENGTEGTENEPTYDLPAFEEEDEE